MSKNRPYFVILYRKKAPLQLPSLSPTPTRWRKHSSTHNHATASKRIAAIPRGKKGWEGYEFKLELMTASQFHQRFP